MSSTLEKRAAIVQRLAEVSQAMAALVDHPRGIAPANMDQWVDLFKERRRLEAQLIEVEPD